MPKALGKAGPNADPNSEQVHVMGAANPIISAFCSFPAPGQQRRQGQAHCKQSRLRKTVSLNSSGDSEASASDFWSEGQSNAPKR